jgi:hypothetical protein
MNKIHRILLSIIAVCVFCLVAWAHSSYTGRTLKSGSGGCGNCHASQTSTVTVAVSGPDTLASGTDGSYSVTISGGSGSSVCVDIATSAGTLKTADANLKLSSSELITNGVKKYASGSYTYNFKLAAPATQQTVTLYATGMSTKSTYNFAPNKTVVVTNISGIDKPSVGSPAFIALSQNYPNPFASGTNIGFTLTQRAAVRLAVYDVSGAERVVLLDEPREAGLHRFEWNGASLQTGMYLCRLTAVMASGEMRSETIKLLVTK